MRSCSLVRFLLHIGLVWGVAHSLIPLAHAQALSYPSKPIVIKVAFPAGGVADAGFRDTLPILQRSLGQVVVIENVTGANGAIAAGSVMNAPADGYTLLGTTGNDLILAPFAIASARYKPETFRLVGLIGVTEFVLVGRANLPLNDIDQLVEYAKNPANKQLTIAHWGAGSTPHIVSADLQGRTGIKLLDVAYRGMAPIVPDLVGAHVDLSFMPLAGPVLGLIKSGKLKPIGLAANHRSELLPNVPTLDESRSVKGFEHTIWLGLFAPPAVPDAAISSLKSAVDKYVDSSEAKTYITSSGGRALTVISPSETAEFFKSEREKLNRVAKAIRIDLQ